MDLSPIHVVPRRRLLTVTGITGIAYTLSWIAGLAVAAPSPKLTASGAQIAAAFAGHQTAVAVQFALTEGLPAAGLAIIAVALARAARRSGAAAAARAALLAGAAAALISLLQFVLGAVLAGTASPGTAHLLYDAVNRLDGVKMLALAVLALAGAASRVLPRWLRYTGIALAIAITASGIAYLLLLQGLAILAIPSGVLLLVFITGTGIVLGTSANKPARCPACNRNGRQSLAMIAVFRHRRPACGTRCKSLPRPPRYRTRSGKGEWNVTGDAVRFRRGDGRKVRHSRRRRRCVGGRSGDLRQPRRDEHRQPAARRPGHVVPCGVGHEDLHGHDADAPGGGGQRSIWTRRCAGMFPSSSSRTSRPRRRSPC